MKRLATILIVGLMGAGCAISSSSGQQPSVIVSESTAAPSAAPPVSASPAPSTPAPSVDAAIVNPRGSGVTLKAGTSGLADLAGGKYRVAWLARSCTNLTIQWVQATGASTPIPVVLPTGETVVDLPKGTGSLDRVADCDYTVRFEAAK